MDEVDSIKFRSPLVLPFIFERESESSFPLRMTALQIPVRLQKLQKGKSSATNSTERRRTHCGTVYFPEGTTANEVCEYISRKQQSATASFGLWLLQIATGDVKDGQPEQTDDGSYTNVKDSKYRLKDGPKYVALHYTGPDIYLVQP